MGDALLHNQSKPVWFSCLNYSRKYSNGMVFRKALPSLPPFPKINSQEARWEMGRKKQGRKQRKKDLPPGESWKIGCLFFLPNTTGFGNGQAKGRMAFGTICFFPRNPPFSVPNFTKFCRIHSFLFSFVFFHPLCSRQRLSVGSSYRVWAAFSRQEEAAPSPPGGPPTPPPSTEHPSRAFTVRDAARWH